MTGTLQNTFPFIADGLAEKGWAMVDGFLSNTEVEAITRHASFAYADEFQRAGVGKQGAHQINKAVRGDRIRWLDDATAPAPVQVYLNRLHALRTYLKEALFLRLVDMEVHQTIYPAGAHYKRHLDQFRKDDHRRLSVIGYLNANWREADGGQLRLYLENGHHDILPIAGRLVCFRSDLLEHEVLPATRPRLSITGWMLDQLADVR
jgi:SM-20-related protein